MDDSVVILVGAFLFLSAIIIFVGIMLIIAEVKLFCKAGIKGWKALIPFYNEVLFCKYFMGQSWLAVIPITTSFLWRWFVRSEDGTLILLSLPVFITSVVFSIVRSIDLGKSFGKKEGFIIGLIFLPFVFKMVIAFSDDQYYGPKGVSTYSYNGYDNYGYGNASNIRDNAYEYNAYNINNGYSNNAGYQNSVYNNNVGYQNGGYNNNSGYQSGGYNNNSGYQNSVDNNNAGYQNNGYNNTTYQNSGNNNYTEYQKIECSSDVTNQNSVNNNNSGYSYDNQYQNNSGVMDDIDISSVNTDDLDNQ